jgi:hypothetical protein
MVGSPQVVYFGILAGRNVPLRSYKGGAKRGSNSTARIESSQGGSLAEFHLAILFVKRISSLVDDSTFWL